MQLLIDLSMDLGVLLHFGFCTVRIERGRYGYGREHACIYSADARGSTIREGPDLTDLDVWTSEMEEMTQYEEHAKHAKDDGFGPHIGWADEAHSVEETEDLAHLILFEAGLIDGGCELRVYRM